MTKPARSLISRELFLKRFYRNFLIVGSLIFGWLLLGMCGYHWLGGLTWIDSLLNAAMIMSGMGPVDVLHSDAAKIFASAYAILSGVIFLGGIGLIAAPLVHRFLHRFHLEEGEEK